jgi:FkbM family methyltransferase
MRRIDRLWHIFTRKSLTPLGRLDLIRIVASRWKKRPGFYSVRNCIGELLVDGQNAGIDFQVLGQVLLDEFYAEVNLKDRIVLDIGAHKGYFAAYALAAGAKAVVCYEPEPTNFYCLSHFAESAQRRGMAIRVVQAAVSDKEGELPFYTSSESWSHSLFHYEGQGCLQTIRVRVASLSAVIADARQAFPAEQIVLKVDAEGAECPLLLDSPGDIFSPVSEIVFEYHPFAPRSLGDIIHRLQLLEFVRLPSLREGDLHLMRRPGGPMSPRARRKIGDDDVHIPSK